MKDCQRQSKKQNNNNNKMVAGLDFLKKKSFHPKNFNNQAKVWETEQRVAEEARKTAELQKQLAEERRKAEMQAMGDALSGKKRIINNNNNNQSQTFSRILI